MTANTMRLPVPGGWLYSVGHQEWNASGLIVDAMCFVPDSTNTHTSPAYMPIDPQVRNDPEVRGG